jgi:hypothetical protein
MSPEHGAAAGPPADADPATTPSQPTPRGALATAWNAICAAIGTTMGLLPHVLHHVGLLAGAALVTGVAGSLLFAVVGLLFSVPLLRRLYRRFGTWKAPASALALFAVMFALSAFVIGPAISNRAPADTPAPVHIPTPSDHGAHHSG